jgi:hypothetical protein
MFQAASYQQLASFNRRIADGRERIAVQKARVLELKGRPVYGDAKGLLRVLERSLQLMIQYQAVLPDELMSGPTIASHQRSGNARQRRHSLAPPCC